MSNRFKNNQVIGVVAESTNELTYAEKYGLTAVEIRVDLLLAAGESVESILRLVSDASNLKLGVLATVRHPSHGGKYAESETKRVALYHTILEAGADLIDVEWDSEAATLLQDVHHRLVLSYHNFDGMPAASELAKLTTSLEAKKPFAIKIVPTATQLADAVCLLDWVSQSLSTTKQSPVRRIGFVMGEQGACSRVLSTCFGGALTYASFGEAVAPGQISLDELLNLYRVPELNETTRVTAVFGKTSSAQQTAAADTASATVTNLNQNYKRDNINRVAIDLSLSTLTEIRALAKALRIDDVVEL